MLYAQIYAVMFLFKNPPRVASSGQCSPAVPRSLAIALHYFMEENEMMEEELFPVKPLILPQ